MPSMMTFVIAVMDQMNQEHLHAAMVSSPAQTQDIDPNISAPHGLMMASVIAVMEQMSMMAR